MEPLIKITTVPIEYELKIEGARLERQMGSAEVEITRDEGRMQIKSRPIKVNLDTFEARASMTPTTAISVSQAADRGVQQAYDATAQFASEGKILIRGKVGAGTETINRILQQRTAPDTGQFQLGFAPSVGPDIQWEAPDISIEYQMDKLNFDAKIDNGNIEFIPGNIELSVTQHPTVTVEYVGKPLYVPPSASERFGGEAIDTEA